MAFSEQILEGKFLYYKGKNQYSEELFKLEKEDKTNGNYTFSSEILSRVATGEFLKVQVEYELTNQLDPLNVRIKRFLGENSSTERYYVDQNSKTVSYSFDGRDGHNDFEKIVSGKFTIGTPAFCTSAIMTLMKKIDSVQKTQYLIVSSNNIWEYTAPFSENSLHVELKSNEPVQIEINGNELSATLCHFIEDIDTEQKPYGEFYLSKHFNIPYKAIFPGDIKVIIDRLKITERANYKKFF